jgi:hypothetical protein
MYYSMKPFVKPASLTYINSEPFKLDQLLPGIQLPFSHTKHEI